MFLKGKSSKETLIKEIMTSPVTFVTPDCTLDTAMSVMTQKRIRHLPVVDGDEVLGIISIGDLMKAIVSDNQRALGALDQLAD